MTNIELYLLSIEIAIALAIENHKPSLLTNFLSPFFQIRGTSMRHSHRIEVRNLITWSVTAGRIEPACVIDANLEFVVKPILRFTISTSAVPSNLFDHRGNSWNR